MLLIDYTTVVHALIYQLLTSHYEQRWKYYLLSEGHGEQGFASEEELLLSEKLFWDVFRALEKKVNLIDVRKCESMKDLYDNSIQSFYLNCCYKHIKKR